MDEQRIKRILERPGACTMENVVWLISVVTQLQEELAQLQADHAEEAARAIKAEEEIDHLRSQLDWSRQRSVSWPRKVMPG